MDVIPTLAVGSPLLNDTRIGSDDNRPGILSLCTVVLIRKTPAEFARLPTSDVLSDF